MQDRAPPAPTPDAIPAGERLASLDFVRGVAVLGIIVANIVAMGQPMLAYGWPGGFISGPGPYSEWLWGAQLVLVDGKFRGLFTLLFGAGMVLFHRRAQAKGRGRGLLARRLAWLGLFGFLHWALLWRGDILMAYALAGALVLWFVDWEWHKQLVLGLIGYAVGAIMGLASSVSMAATAQGSFPPGSSMAAIQRGLRETEAADIADARVDSALTIGGDYLGTVRHSLEHHLAEIPGTLGIGLFETAPLMLIGMALLGAGVFEQRPGRERQLRLGWLLWSAGTLLTLPLAWWTMARGITYWDSFAALYGWLPLPQLLSALGLLLLLVHLGSERDSWLAARLKNAGRCAFTNYIGTSALALVVFSGWGFGLFGTLGRLELYAVVLGFWALMLAWPRWWLARFRYGPLEWLWRCLTYGRRFALRR